MESLDPDTDKDPDADRMAPSSPRTTTADAERILLLEQLAQVEAKRVGGLGNRHERATLGKGGTSWRTYRFRTFLVQKGEDGWLVAVIFVAAVVRLPRFARII